MILRVASDTWRLCRPSEALTSLPILWQSPPPEGPLQLKKEKIGGGNLKNAKGFFWWGERADLPAGVGAELQHFVLK